MNITVRMIKNSVLCPFKEGTLLHTKGVLMLSSEFTGIQIVLRAVPAGVENPPHGRVVQIEDIEIVRGDIGDAMLLSLLNTYSKILCL